MLKVNKGDYSLIKGFLAKELQVKKSQITLWESNETDGGNLNTVIDLTFGVEYNRITKHTYKVQGFKNEYGVHINCYTIEQVEDYN